LSIVRVDSVDQHELSITFQIASSFVDFATHYLTIMDQNNRRKASASIDLLYAEIPQVNRIEIQQQNKVRRDTLLYSPLHKTTAILQLQGKGLLNSGKILFDDPLIQAKEICENEASSSFHKKVVAVEISNTDIELGSKVFRVLSPYAPTAVCSLFLKSELAPQIMSPVNSFIADGKLKTFEITGNNFSTGVTLSLLPTDGKIVGRRVTDDKIQIQLLLPIFEETKSYRIIGD